MRAQPRDRRRSRRRRSVSEVFPDLGADHLLAALCDLMPPRPIERPLPRLALNQAEAAASIGVSLATFKRRVAPHIKCVYLGGARLYPADALAEWLNKHAVDPSIREPR
jgi:hypothetical protein